MCALLIHCLPSCTVAPPPQCNWPRQAGGQPTIIMGPPRASSIGSSHTLKGLGASLLFVCRLAWILTLARDCGEQENHASNGGRTWDALLTVLMAAVSLLGQAKGSGRLHAPLGRMPTIRICILGPLEDAAPGADAPLQLRPAGRQVLLPHDCQDLQSMLQGHPSFKSALNQSQSRAQTLLAKQQ